MTLGNGLTEDWQLPEMVLDRVPTLVDLYQKRTADRLLLSGGYSVNFDLKGIKPPTTEARELKKVLVGLGVSEKSIYLEERSRDTIGNFYFSKKCYLEPKGWKKIAVVCADFHDERARALAKKILGVGYELKFVATPTKWVGDREVRKVQVETMRKQLEFLDSLGEDLDGELERRLYLDPFFTSVRPRKGAAFAMRGVKH